MFEYHLKRAAAKLLYMASTIRLFFPPIDQEKIGIEALRAEVHQLPPLAIRDGASSEESWQNNLRRLRELILSRDPRGFLRWDVIAQTMYIKNAEYIRQEFEYLKQLPDWESRWHKAIRESSVGSPMPYWQDLHTSSTLIHHAYHIARLEEKTATSINDMDYVCEFGGGYGGMCRLIYNLGFNGKYVIFDLPEFSALQHYFLTALQLKVSPVQDSKTDAKEVVCISDLEQFRELLIGAAGKSNSMFIATWSISEVPINMRASILSLISSFKTILIAYQNQFEQKDNIDFFRNWREDQKNKTWHHWQIEHLPHNYYLIGQTTPSSNKSNDLHCFSLQISS